MSQTPLLPITIVHELDASSSGFDGKDLKRIAYCDDGNTYAMKRVQDGQLIPIAEWVGYHLCRRCSVLTPDFAILHSQDGSPPSFGSRISDYSQIEHDPSSFRINSFFGEHLTALSAIYSLDAVIINPDRHGRNIFVERASGRKSAAVRAFDFSRAWLVTGPPFGFQEALRDSHTQKWWKTLHRLGCRVNSHTVDLMKNTDASWLSEVIKSAPGEWFSSVDVNATITFWEGQRKHRIDWAERWLT